MKRMQALRLARGWSRAELARRASMDPSDVGRIESGLMVAYTSQTKKLAKALGVSPQNSGTLYEQIEARDEVAS